MSEIRRSKPAASVHLRRGDGREQRRIVLVLLATVVLVDQAIKWWAWRHAPGARINAGGDVFVGSTVGAWYDHPVTGALLDVLDCVLLLIALFILLRRPRRALALVAGALTIAGWSSNVLDRLGLHYWSAPGSERGTIDFIPLGNHHYNVADFFIFSGTVLFIVSL